LRYIGNGFTERHEIWRILTLVTRPTVKNIRFKKSKMAAAAILKKPKLGYLGNSLADHNEIWHNDAVQHL